ncbi:GIY-YIG nuclease family protein [Vibrio sp. SCSIO 43137]|uniref:GIY-YIG nuclease family protein n=1 Tax=Vibrio sp. SCSIO 43137 TaxID=3021011 RepID=UPI002307B94D|nr:GIY-YIG nuclease family protein [Vibrio sp. SCSIO 43137]WCE31683.1 GIY-YIG nuclease family protein [Vibrio sp. SCSIO 43137]
MDLVTIMHDLVSDDKYRFHLAKPSTKGTRPLDALTKSKEDWLSWQRYRGNAKERFPVNYIVSFAQISGNRFLFGGVFKITSRASKEYSVQYTRDYAELIGRLILEFTGNNSMATVFKPSYIYENSQVSGIYEHRFQGEPFRSYEEINHSFNAIEIIIKNSLPDWKVALSSIYGIYLISDKKTGKHYVGSAYGSSGIWGRWSNYVNNFHGSNDDLVELFNNKSEAYFRENFKFCLLEVLSSSSTKEEVINKESLWKKKLFTKEHGHNRN